MVKQYPNRLVIYTQDGSVQDNNGNWQPGETSSVEKACRAEPNSKNSMIKTADGTAIIPQYTVYLPLPIDNVAIGSKVEVFEGEDILCTSTVKLFSKGQLNARVWL